MNHPIDQFESYLAGGLDAEEQEAFQAHVDNCDTCQAALEKAREADERMNDLFAGQQPGNDFEERMVAKLQRRQKLTHPLIRRIAVGVAASIVLGGVGYVGSAGINEGRLPEFSWFGGHGKVLARWAKLDDEQTSANNSREGAYTITSAHAPQSAAASPVITKSSLKLDGTVSVAESTMQGSPPAFLATRNPLSGKHEYAYRNATDQEMFPHALGNVEVLKRLADEKAPEAAARFDPVKLAAADREKSALQITTPVAASPAPASKSNAFAAGFDRGAKERGEKEAEYDGAAPANQPVASALPQQLNGNKDEKASEGKLSWQEARKQAKEVDRLEEKLKNTSATHSESAGLQVAQADIKPRRDNGTPSDTGKSQPAEPPKPNADAKPVDAPPAAQSAPAAPPATEAVVKPKIIRTGEMEFEVDSFDSTVLNIGKIVSEELGYISTTNSDKLPNGKVKGSIVLRVPAEHLDTLVLKLRGIGELHSQRINAQDITKQYTDIESSLRAAKAMQERLLDIIKNGKGAVKDLLEAEKQLGTWREKVEQLEGEIRYYSNQVAFSTLTLTLLERDLRAPASASETESVTMALETDKVDDVYAKAKDAITTAKGRIISSELKQFDAGQFGATIVAQVPPDQADAVIGHLKQFDGRLARFERQRAQTTSNGNSPVDPRIPGDSIKVKREDVTINLTLYNLENVAPRRTTTLTLVAADVEQTYHALIEQIRAAGGRVVTSQVNRVKADQMAGTINFQVPTDKAEVVLAALRGSGEVLKTETAESADTQNVTESKRGFVVTIGSLPAFAARETQQVQLASLKVPDAFNDLLNLIRSDKGRIIQSRLDEQDRGTTTGTLEFEIGRELFSTLDAAMLKDGQIVTRQVNRSVDTDNTVDSKVHIALSIGSSEQLPPRQSTDLSVEVQDVQKSMDDLLAAALTAGGRQVDNPAISQGDNGQTIATLTLDVPLDRVQTLVDSADGMGTRKLRRTTIDSHAPEGKLARAKLTATFSTPATLAGSEDGILAGVRRGLGTSLRGLSYSLTLIIIGLCLIAPWVILVGGIWRGVKWAKRGSVK